MAGHSMARMAKITDRKRQAETVSPLPEAELVSPGKPGRVRGRAAQERLATIRAYTAKDPLLRG